MINLVKICYKNTVSTISDHLTWLWTHAGAVRTLLWNRALDESTPRGHVNVHVIGAQKFLPWRETMCQLLCTKYLYKAKNKMFTLRDPGNKG